MTITEAKRIIETKTDQLYRISFETWGNTQTGNAEPHWTIGGIHLIPGRAFVGAPTLEAAVESFVAAFDGGDSEELERKAQEAIDV